MATRHATAPREGARTAREASSPPPPTEERADVYARVTDAIVAASESGMAKGRDWRMS
jgi:antirestriction protein ArdC